jgi:hypothetical protein
MRRCILLLATLCAVPAGAAGQGVRLGARVPGRPPLSLDADSVRITAEAGRSALWEALAWIPARTGMDWAEIELSAGPLGVPVRAVAVRIDPRLYRFRLDWSTRPNGMTGSWLSDSLTADAALALNAGQFKETGPWGWVVLAGEERRDPGAGPLSVGVAFTDTGTVEWIRPDGLDAARGDRHITFAFQTYPSLLVDGRVPGPALDADQVNQEHRDARLILGERADGTLVVVLTRFDAFGSAAERIPIGLNLPESIVLMRALGARQAAMLDGGISAQMALRSSDGRVQAWRGLRPVPLALVVTPR